MVKGTAEIDPSSYERDGYCVARGLFSPEETDLLRDHYMVLRKKSAYPGDSVGVDPEQDDPLKQYPRMIHMHRWDDVSLEWMIDDRIDAWLTKLIGAPPLAVQTMLYFKPPGSRGQALHQDQFYLKARPGTCVAAWMALDPCRIENGCMQVVPGTQDLTVLCTNSDADLAVSFSQTTVPLPDSMASVPVEMEPGDVLFFNGSVVHGSYQNMTADRFRRALIGHYISSDAVEVAKFYHPVLRMDGSEVSLEESPGGGPCGVWVDQNGEPVVELVTE